MLTQEDIQKIQYLLNEIQNKKETLQNQKQQLEVEIKVLEKEKEELEKFFQEQLGTTDLDEIKKIIQNYENEIKEWIKETEEQLSQI